MLSEMADYPLRRSLPATDVTSEQHIWNWAQNAPLGPQTRLQRPQDEEALRHIITHRSGRIRPIGTTLSTGDLLAIQHEQDTLIDISGLTGLLRSSESSATFAAGTPLNEVYETLKTLGRMLPASPGVIAIQTLAGAIATGTHGQGLGQGALARVSLTALRRRQIGELSGGQRKRVFLARALAQQARILLLDEPFTGVDSQTESTIITLLRQPRKEGHLVLISTHNLASVPTYCDRVVLINGGVVAAGPVEKTFTADNLRRAFGGSLPLQVLTGAPGDA